MTVEPEYHEYDIEKQNVIDDITTDPVIKSNWKSIGARDYWSDSLATFIELIPDFIIEVLQTDAHPRDAFILDTTENVQKEFETRIQDTPITTIHRSEPREERSFQIFTDYTNAVSIVDQQLSNTYAIVGKDESTAEEVNRLLEQEPHNSDEAFENLAGIFGWPDCCAEFHSQSVHRQHRDPLYEIACRTPSSEPIEDNRHITVKFPDAFLNQFWRYHGFRFAYHLPCSFECDESGSRARTNYEIYKSIAGEDETHIETVLTWLDQPTYWSGYHGLTHIKNAYGIGTYHTDNNWNEKQIVWIAEHENKPELEVNHPTTEYEAINPEYGAL